MGRKLRLSVHRKNEFRKKQAKKQRYTVTVRESLPISLTLDKVTVLKISIPKDMLYMYGKQSVGWSYVDSRYWHLHVMD